MTRFEEQPWFVAISADWSWARLAWHRASRPLRFAWARLVMWLWRMWARLRQKWYRLGMWHREALRWEGIARDYGERLEGLGDWDWIGAYRSARHAAWWERWNEM